MQSIFRNTSRASRVGAVCVLAWVGLSGSGRLGAQQKVATHPSASTAPQPATTASSAGPKLFDTPKQAADALVGAAATFDVAALKEIFGPDGDDVVFTGEFAQDRQHAAEFAAEAHEKQSVSVDPRTGTRAFLIVGNEEWPFPVPVVQKVGMGVRPERRRRPPELLLKRRQPMNSMPLKSAAVTWTRRTSTPFGSGSFTT